MKAASVSPGFMATAKTYVAPPCFFTIVATGTSLFEDSTLSASLTVGLFSAGASSRICLLIAVTAASILGIVQERVLVELGLEFMDEIDDSAAPMHQAIQTSALTCLGVALASALNPRAFDAVPDGLASVSPLDQPLDAPADQIQLASELRGTSRHGVDVERGDVASLDVLGVVLGVTAAHAAVREVVPGHAPAEIEEHRPGGIRLAERLVFLNDLGRQHGRPVALPSREPWALSGSSPCIQPTMIGSSLWASPTAFWSQMTCIPHFLSSASWASVGPSHRAK